MPLAVKQAAASVAAKKAQSDPSLAAALPVPPLQGGPGTELKKLLARWPWRIVDAGGCQCSSRAILMDQNESLQPGWCEANIDTIVRWLREEAKARSLPFLDAAGRMLVRRAIQNARRAAAS